MTTETRAAMEVLADVLAREERKAAQICHAYRVAETYCGTEPRPDQVGRKDDAGKHDYALLPWLALEQVQAVLDYGAKKYTAQGWREVKGPTRYLSAALRHLFAYARGEDNDPESGLPHLAHAACCVLFRLEKEHPDYAATEALRQARIARLGED